jgi:hypothetical protein
MVVPFLIKRAFRLALHQTTKMLPVKHTISFLLLTYTSSPEIPVPAVVSFRRSQFHVPDIASTGAANLTQLVALINE